MKRQVWANRSNSQLCVTIPKNSGIKEGEIVSIEKEKVKTIVYSVVTADLFHYGQLQLLQKANKLGEFHICGVVTNKAMKSYRKEPIANLQERASIISALRCVDMVMIQNTKDPTKNIKKIHEQFKDAKIILVYGSNWKKVPGKEFITSIGGRVVQPVFYKKLSMENIASKIIKLYGGNLQ